MPIPPSRTGGTTPAVPPRRAAAPATPQEAVPRPDGPDPSMTPLALVRATADVLPLLDSVTLAPYEQHRAARLPAGERREDYLAAHALVRVCAARLLGVPPAGLTLGQVCAGCGGEDHGRPYLRDHPGVGVSLSHARGAVAAAAGPGPVGVDVEDASAAVFDARVAARSLAPAELAAVRAAPDPARSFLRLWVRKEALVKVGVTTLGRLRAVDLTDPGAPAGWRFADWSSPDGRLTAAAVARTTPAVDGGNDPDSSRSAYPGEQHA
ncbi:4'-phosphopantetheinyl transferase superfamily protein [Streptomyces sp. DH24]|uniref:4'-phosphopantetheinyl transferase family protein n=1 Tax=Streptomyces sp. DH24 TaxID=3040123 RepID=UPI002441C2BB|nr:4'-phosphopantetheinyl transferase superfamily protein [Streptomyces sp. DH24]MDG9720487.1 4'-phosphopantetheinyl transferase superfamily protein [Streptomyces sp. DH24]